MRTRTESRTFLRHRFADPILWEQDCFRCIGRILVGWAAHYCYEWDGLPVDETTPEFDACLCWPGNLEFGGIGEGAL